MDALKIRNPKTNRMIKVNGPTYIKLLKEGYSIVNGELCICEKEFEDMTLDEITPISRYNHYVNICLAGFEMFRIIGYPSRALVESCGLASVYPFIIMRISTNYVKAKTDLHPIHLECAIKDVLRIKRHFRKFKDEIIEKSNHPKRLQYLFDHYNHEEVFNSHF
jgi:hypothetical protein